MPGPLGRRDVAAVFLTTHASETMLAYRINLDAGALGPVVARQGGTSEYDDHPFEFTSSAIPLRTDAERLAIWTIPRLTTFGAGYLWTYDVAAPDRGGTFEPFACPLPQVMNAQLEGLWDRPVLLDGTVYAASNRSFGLNHVPAAVERIDPGGSVEVVRTPNLEAGTQAYLAAPLTSVRDSDGREYMSWAYTTYEGRDAVVRREVLRSDGSLLTSDTLRVEGISYSSGETFARTGSLDVRGVSDLGDDEILVQYTEPLGVGEFAFAIPIRGLRPRSFYHGLPGTDAAGAVGFFTNDSLYAFDASGVILDAVETPASESFRPPAPHAVTENWAVVDIEGGATVFAFDGRVWSESHSVNAPPFDLASHAVLGGDRMLGATTVYTPAGYAVQVWGIDVGVPGAEWTLYAETNPAQGWRAPVIDSDHAERAVVWVSDNGNGSPSSRKNGYVEFDAATLSSGGAPTAEAPRYRIVNPVAGRRLTVLAPLGAAAPRRAALCHVDGRPLRTLGTPDRVGGGFSYALPAGGMPGGAYVLHLDGTAQLVLVAR